MGLDWHDHLKIEVNKFEVWFEYYEVKGLHFKICYLNPNGEKWQQTNNNLEVYKWIPDNKLGIKKNTHIVYLSTLLDFLNTTRPLTTHCDRY